MGEADEKKTEYSLKPPTTYKEQVQLLTERNLIITDESLVIAVLRKVNYYRLSAYFLSLKDGESFKEGVTFEQIYDLYKFDTRLRNLLMEQLENIEVAFRSQISYLLAHKYGNLGYKNQENFVDENRHTEFVDDVAICLRRQKELFIQHYNVNYGGQFPIWVAIEVTSFGTLSKLYANMKPEDKKKIADDYYNKIPQVFIENWLMVLSYIRNICAHFARTYNKSLAKKPRLFKGDRQRFQNDKVFAAIFIMGKLSRFSPDWTNFVTKLDALIEEYKDVIELDRIGFPENWKDLLR